MPLDPATLSNVLLLLTAWGGAFVLALWLSLIFWTYRDVRARAKDNFMRILAVLVVAILFLPGIVIYLILRPSQTIEEEYQSTLEEEALLQTVEHSHHCPGCGIRTQDDWMVCPNCHTRLKKTCHHCSKAMELSWDLCAYCGTPVPGIRKESMTLDDALQPLPADSEDSSE